MKQSFPVPSVRPFFAAIVVCVSLFLTVISSRAANDLWNGGGAPDGNWQNPANWGGTAPVAGDLLTFDGTTQTSATNNFAAGTGFDAITFDATAGAFTLAPVNGGDGSAITLGWPTEVPGGLMNGGGITNLPTGPETIALPLVLSAGNHVVTNAGTAGALNLAGNVTRNAGTTVEFFTTGGSINATGSGLANDSSAGGGLLGGWAVIGVANNAGNWAAVNSGTNIIAYSGYTSESSSFTTSVGGNYKETANNGTLKVTAESGSSYVDMNTLLCNPGTSHGETIEANTASQPLRLGVEGGIMNINGNSQTITIGGGSSYYLTAGGATANNPGEMTLVQLGSGSGRLVINSVIQNNGTGAVKVNQLGSVNYNFANTYSGGTWLQYGEGYLQGGATFGSGPVYVFPGARADYGGNNSVTVANSFYIAGYGSYEAGSANPGAIKGSYNGTFTGPFTLMGDAQIDPNAGGSPNTCTFSGGFSGTGSLMIGGPAGVVAGSATFGGNCSFTGNLVVDATANANGGAGVIISSGMNNILNQGGSVVLNGGTIGIATLDLNGTTQTINGLYATNANPGNTVVKSSAAGGMLVLGNHNASSQSYGNLENGSGSLGVTKIGTGTVALDWVNSYTGPTIVSNGVLSIGDSLASAQITTVSPGVLDFSQLGTFALASGQTLSGNGAVNGGISAGTGSTISPGFDGGTLTVSNDVTMGTGSVGYFVLTPATNGVNSLLVVDGNLNLNGGTVQISATTLEVGRYKLITYAGAESGSAAANLTLSYNGTQNVSLDDSIPGEIDLVVSSAFVTKLTWEGDGSQNIWDVDNTADWLNGGLASFYTNATAVVFNDTGSKSPAVNLDTTVQPLSLLVSNNTGVYTIGGSGNIAGGTALTKLGTGGLVLADTGGDSFSGGVFVGGGSLTFSNENMNLSGGLTVSNSTAMVDGSGAIAGNLTVQTGGSVLLDQAPGFNFTGNLTINTNASAQLGADDGNGALPAGNLTVNGTLTFEQVSDTMVSSAIAGFGTLVKNTNNTVTLSAASSFTGNINITAGTLSSPTASGLGNVNSGTITIANGATLNKGTDEAKPIIVSGAGVGGAGAIINTSGNPVYDGGNGGLTPSLTLTGDTTFGGNTRMDLGGNTGAILSTSGSNYNVVIDNANYIEWQKVSIDTNLGNIDVLTAYFGFKGCGAGLGNPTNTVTVHPGADLQFWGDTSGGANSGYNKNIHVMSGATVEFRPQTANVYYACPLTLEDSSDMNLFNGSGTIGTVLLGPVVLNGFVHFQVGDSTCTVSNVISGPGGFYWDNYNNTLVFTATNTYQGVTDIRSGRTLALHGNGSILTSTNILLGTNTTLDASGRVDGTLTLGNQTFASAAGASSSIAGMLDAGSGSTLVPGGSGATGTLMVSSNIVLQGTLAMDLDQAGSTNDVVTAGANSAITYGGTLDLTTITGTLAAGQTYKLFNAGSYTGAFAAISPATPGAGLLWNTNSLITSGTLGVVPAVVPVITGISLSGATLTLTATNGEASASFVLLSTTNLTLPLAQWTPVLTNSFDASGNLNLSTNVVSPGVAAQFFMLVQ